MDNITYSYADLAKEHPWAHRFVAGFVCLTDLYDKDGPKILLVPQLMSDPERYIGPPKGSAINPSLNIFVENDGLLENDTLTTAIRKLHAETKLSVEDIICISPSIIIIARRDVGEVATFFIALWSKIECTENSRLVNVRDLLKINNISIITKSLFAVLLCIEWSSFNFIPTKIGAIGQNDKMTEKIVKKIKDNISSDEIIMYHSDDNNNTEDIKMLFREDLIAPIFEDENNENHLVSLNVIKQKEDINKKTQSDHFKIFNDKGADKLYQIKRNYDCENYYQKNEKFYDPKVAVKKMYADIIKPKVINKNVTEKNDVWPRQKNYRSDITLKKNTHDEKLFPLKTNILRPHVSKKNDDDIINKIKFLCNEIDEHLSKK